MTKYIKQERAKYWPVSPELMAQYKDGSHTAKDSNGLYWLDQNNKLHRDGDKPARIDRDGALYWWQNNQYHRDGDLPAYIGRDGTLEWYQNGERHRDGDKPAYISADGNLRWYQNSEIHRSRGPARIYTNGRLEWWINDKHITQEVNEWLNKKHWRGTPEQVFEFQLRFL